MVELFRAELQKVIGNRWATGFLLWVFPVGALGFSLVMIIILLVVPAARQDAMGESITWTEQVIGVWSFPSNVFGRMLLLGFTAVVFAGEYQWGTWKNVVPRQRRTALILVKFLTVGLLVVLAFGLMSVIWGVGQCIMAAIAGVEYGPPLSAEVLRSFAADYALEAGLAFTSVIIGASYVALIALFMRSILGGVMVGLGITVAEPLSLFALFSISRLLDLPWIVSLFRYSPFYNLDNVHSWIIRNGPSDFGNLFSGVGTEYVFTAGLAYSVTVLFLWLAGLVALNVFLFQRQDITT